MLKWLAKFVLWRSAFQGLGLAGRAVAHQNAYGFARRPTGKSKGDAFNGKPNNSIAEITPSSDMMRHTKIDANDQSGPADNHRARDLCLMRGLSGSLGPEVLLEP